jgi:S-sulfo-L-cysteine synthase (O-acetyl-L-serine-dependent)
VSQAEAEEMTRRLAREEGIFAGISSGGAVHVALRVSKELKNAVIVTIICDRGDRYLTTGVFPD